MNKLLLLIFVGCLILSCAEEQKDAESENAKNERFENRSDTKAPEDMKKEEVLTENLSWDLVKKRALLGSLTFQEYLSAIPDGKLPVSYSKDFSSLLIEKGSNNSEEKEMVEYKINMDELKKYPVLFTCSNSTASDSEQKIPNSHYHFSNIINSLRIKDNDSIMGFTPANMPDLNNGYFGEGNFYFIAPLSKFTHQNQVVIIYLTSLSLMSNYPMIQAVVYDQEGEFSGNYESNPEDIVSAAAIDCFYRKTKGEIDTSYILKTEKYSTECQYDENGEMSGSLPEIVERKMLFYTITDEGWTLIKGNK